MALPEITVIMVTVITFVMHLVGKVPSRYKNWECTALSLFQYSYNDR